jgi:F-type H+-transporting ATPase subunit epsilon
MRPRKTSSRAGHAPLIAMLRPGIMTIHRDGDRQKIVVNGGFAEVNPAGLTVLADKAVALEDFDRDELAREIKDAEEDLEDSKNDQARDKLARHLEQLKSLQTALA